MPLPSPKKSEAKDKFVGRCISTLTKSGEFNSQKQRVAVCFTQWRRSKGGDK